MKEPQEAWIQLATRIPKTLHREMKLHCLHADSSLMDFVVKAIEERLRKVSGGGKTQKREVGRRA